MSLRQDNKKSAETDRKADPDKLGSERFRYIRRLLVEPSRSAELPSDPRPVFTICAASALCAGVIGWVTASAYPSLIVPVCAVFAVVGGLLGVRSKLRSLGLVGFIMGMFLLPVAVSIILDTVRS